MIKETDYKVSGGKLIRIKAEVENNFLQDVKITGDFFLHPEESIELIERSLIGKKLEKEELEMTIKDVIEKNNIKLLGISEKDFVEALMKLRFFFDK